MTCEVIWIIKILVDLNVNNLTPVNVYCDNESVIKLALNPVFHDKTKHFEVDLHFIREKIEKRVIKLGKVESVHQTADLLTKSLITTQHNYLVNRLNLIDPFAAENKK